MIIDKSHIIGAPSSMPIGKIGQMGMHAVRHLPLVDFLTLGVFKNFLNVVDSWDGSLKQKLIIQERARDINLVLATGSIVYLFISSLGYDNMECAFFCSLVWIPICLFGNKV